MTESGKSMMQNRWVTGCDVNFNYIKLKENKFYFILLER